MSEQNRGWVHPLFQVRDLVEKDGGYEFPGEVVAAFHTRDGKVRYVVEHLTSMGLLHIFSESQLRRRIR